MHSKAYALSVPNNEQLSAPLEHETYEMSCPLCNSVFYLRQSLEFMLERVEEACEAGTNDEAMLPTPVPAPAAAHAPDVRPSGAQAPAPLAAHGVRHHAAGRGARRAPWPSSPGFF